MDKEFKASTRSDILKAFIAAEKIEKPLFSEMFTDVYDEIPLHLQEQEKELKELISKNAF